MKYDNRGTGTSCLKFMIVRKRTYLPNQKELLLAGPLRWSNCTWWHFLFSSDLSFQAVVCRTVQLLRARRYLLHLFIFSITWSANDALMIGEWMDTVDSLVALKIVLLYSTFPYTISHGNLGKRNQCQKDATLTSHESSFMFKSYTCSLRL